MSDNSLHTYEVIKNELVVAAPEPDMDFLPAFHSGIGNKNDCLILKPVIDDSDVLDKWSPQVHNGYYYINQKEYCLYSQYDNGLKTFVNNSYTVSPLPQQFLPIIVINSDGQNLKRVYSMEDLTLNTFIANYDIPNDRMTIVKDTNVSAKIIFERNKLDNKLVLSHLSLNPIYNIDNKGFIYLSKDVELPKKVVIHANPKVIKADGKDNVGIYINIMDGYGNPITDETVTVTTTIGTKSIDSYVSDINGVVVARYISSAIAGEATITVACTSDININNSIKIINK